ncbi:MAG: hypothetical protein NXI04_27115 [Planctomycetaceae bacterium]|nr:hypothetical protein [Planctomycetaceae bacterium]
MAPPAPEVPAPAVAPAVPQPTAETGPVFGAPDADSAIFPPQPDTQVESPVPTVTPAGGSASVARRLRKKSRRRGSQQVLMWLIPVVCLGVFLGVVAIVTNLQTPELKGTLIGARALGLELPPASVSRSLLKLGDGEKVKVVNAFLTNPESFVSGQMTCRIGVEEDSIIVEFSPGDGFAWFSVNPGNSLPLKDWIRDNREPLNQARLAWLSQSATDLARDKLSKVAGQPVQFDAIEYRNGVGVNAHVKAFGFVVEAVAGEKKSFGFHEDSNGTVYFALPETTKSFVIRGRTINGEVLFPGEYQVTVAQTETENPGADTGLGGGGEKPGDSADNPSSDAMDDPDSMDSPADDMKSDDSMMNGGMGGMNVTTVRQNGFR